VYANARTIGVVALIVMLGLGLGLVWLLSDGPSMVERLPTPTGMFAGPILQTPAPNETPAPALLERRWLVLEWPRTIREKDSDLVVLTIAVDEGGGLTATVLQPGQGDGQSTPVDIPNIYETHSLLAVARLDMAGMEVYRDSIREPLLPGRPATFRWSVRANDSGTYRGVVWLHLEMIPRGGGAVNEMLLLSRPIEIRAVTVLGLPGDLARVLGGFALAASTILGFPFVQQWIERMRKGRPTPAVARADNGEGKRAAKTTHRPAGKTQPVNRKDQGRPGSKK
jgi:hypothetical protein